MTSRLLLVPLLLLLSGAPAVHAKTDGFTRWKQGFAVRLKQQGFDPPAIDLFLRAAHFVERPVRAQARQPEKIARFDSYRRNLITDRRIAEGQALLRDYGPFYRQMAERFGIEPQVLVALWGIESSYGRSLGSHPVIASLASLAYAGRRRDFFEKELVAAVRYAARGEVPPERMTGSWAGAMGHYQFIPTTFERFGIDGDGDGRINLWDSYSDAVASAANYLKQIGWQTGDARIVRLEEQGARAVLDKAGLDRYHPASYWLRTGLLPDGGDAGSSRLKIVAPDEGRSGYYLVGEGFDRLREWNRSTYFALAVLMLADAVAVSPEPPGVPSAAPEPPGQNQQPADEQVK